MKKIMFNDKFGLTKAVIEGRKTMTRRIVPTRILEDCVVVCEVALKSTYKIGEVVAIAQNYITIMEYYHSLGSIDVRTESEQERRFWNDMRDFETYGNDSAMRGDLNKMFVRADLMPHQIKITDIKVERLQDISDEDCLKEGVSTLNDGAPMSGYFVFDRPRNIKSCYNTPREAFAALIDKVSGKGTWNSNPWVFAYSFELIK